MCPKNYEQYSVKVPKKYNARESFQADNINYSMQYPDLYRHQSLFQSAPKPPVWSIYSHQFVCCHNGTTVVLPISRNTRVNSSPQRVEIVFGYGDILFFATEGQR